MEELRRVLLAHASKYPMMKPTDAVKLIYQNEFGGGHLIKDVTGCMNYLFQEYDAITKSEDSPLYESIGNGLVRVHLSAVRKDQLELLGSAFIRSASAHQGNSERFFEKLEVLKVLASQGTYSFGFRELQQYLTQYVAAGCPAVSHSEVYRQQYRPAYRVIRRCEMECLF